MSDRPPHEAEPHVSVVLCTYNRQELLPTALRGLSTQEAEGVRYEIIVVDNNSTDQTREVVGRFARDVDGRIRYLFEGRQGVSYARNAGIAAARAPIIAFTDDDVWVASNWIATIRTVFDAETIDCVGGKVLPLWSVEPPRWLTKLHWSPLALVDRGEERLVGNTSKPLVLITANLAVRRRVFDTVGLFAPDFQRVKDAIGSTEDHEFMLRIYDAGLRALYVPELIAHAPVQDDRLTKAYHRRWHSGHGRFMARMRAVEPDPAAPQLFGLPSHYYGSLLREGTAWWSAMWRRDGEFAFWHELQLRSGVQFVLASRQMQAHSNVASEALRFVRELLRKKWSGSRSAHP